MDRFLKALKREKVDRAPVWFMRQAGRYLPEYRAIRERAGGFLNMCQNPEIAAEITLQPLQRFDLDAGIIFSDILTIPDAMGLGLHFKQNEGPHFERPIRTIKDIERLPTELDLGYVMEAIRLVSKDIRVPLIGFCGSPWTVATYMVEGQSSRTFSIIKQMMYSEPETFKLLLDKLVTASTHYLQAQVNAGAKALMIFDTWGGVLTPEDYLTFSLNPMQEIVKQLNVPVILFTKQGGQHLEKIAQTGCAGVGIDWTVDMQDAKRRVGHLVTLQGNLDPSALYADPKTIQQKVKAILNCFPDNQGHIFNLGHGLYPDISPEKVQVVIDTIQGKV